MITLNVMKPPSTVRRAVKMFAASLLLGPVQLLFPDSLTQQAFMAAPAFSVIVLGGVLALLLLLLWSIYRAKNWARVVLTVLFVLGIPLLPFTLPIQFSASLIAGIAAVVQIVLQVMALLSLYRVESAQWFRPPLTGNSISDEVVTLSISLASAPGIRVCAHCKLKVIPTHDGKCPSCQGIIGGADAATA